MAEFIEDVSDENARYGIATVQPNRALKKCKIRNIRIEYFITPTAIFAVPPRYCAICDRSDQCVDDFVLQIVEKYNSSNKNSEAYYLL